MNLYHHHDGYPTGVGQELERALDGKCFGSAMECARYLIDEVSSEYELSPEGIHGDIEYLYSINLYAMHYITCETKNGQIYQHYINVSEPDDRLSCTVNGSPTA